MGTLPKSNSSPLEIGLFPPQKESSSSNRLFLGGSVGFWEGNYKTSTSVFVGGPNKNPAIKIRATPLEPLHQVRQMPLSLWDLCLGFRRDRRSNWVYWMAVSNVSKALEIMGSTYLFE